MSGALVPASSNFQQQATVDWVELSGRSVNFSVAVLARLSKAGIDPFTLQVGRAICTNFALDPVAQQRISEAIQPLRKFGSYGDIIWFGFGVKHVVTDLAETEQGLTLVALCAALSSTYNSLYGARVLRELCGLCKAPQTFSPAVRQWKILVELCSGILNSGHFSLLLEGFRRLVLGGRDLPDLRKTERYPTGCSTLAEAIMTISQLTTKRLVSATFTGGLDCIWLAAVAESIFSLDVVIYNSGDAQLYRSRSLDQQPPQVRICYTEKLTDSQEQKVVSEKTSLISSIRTLFVREDGNSANYPRPFNWRSSWSTILGDTFPGAIDILLTGENAHQFRLYIYCLSMVQQDEDFPSVRGNISYLFFRYLVDPLCGRKFLSFASKRLPELSHCLEHDFSRAPQGRFHICSREALSELESKGDCIYSEGQGQIKLTTLTECISVFLWITLATDIDEQIAPSINGLRWLYEYLLSNGDIGVSIERDAKVGDFAKVRDFAKIEQIPLVFCALSGSGEPSFSSNLLAVAGAGVCVYRQVLSDPHLSPHLISRIRVVPGYISHAGGVFKTISSISRTIHLENPVDALSTCQSVDAIVQETEQDSELAATYQVNYINRQGEKKYLLLDLSALFYKLQLIVETFKCEGDCLNPPRLALFDQAASDNAHRLIADLQHLQNPWVSISMLDSNGRESKSVDMKMLIDRPFMIYLSLMEHSRSHVCVFPLIQCLNCMIEQGWLGNLNIRRQASTGSGRLVAPGRAEAKIQWETWEPEIPQEPSAVSRKENRKRSRRKYAAPSSKITGALMEEFLR